LGYGQQKKVVESATYMYHKLKYSC